VKFFAARVRRGQPDFLDAVFAPMAGIGGNHYAENAQDESGDLLVPWIHELKVRCCGGRGL